jgi:hypothetical protein
MFQSERNLVQIELQRPLKISLAARLLASQPKKVLSMRDPWILFKKLL